jgi:hypothetical protein
MRAAPVMTYLQRANRFKSETQIRDHNTTFNNLRQLQGQLENTSGLSYF